MTSDALIVSQTPQGTVSGAFSLLGAPGLLLGGALWVFSEEEATTCAVSCGFEDLKSKWAASPRPFAMDAFGDFWVIGKNGNVVRINTEVFDLVHTYPSLEAWFHEDLSDTENETGAEIFKAWETEHGRLPVIGLCPKSLSSWAAHTILRICFPCR